MGAEGGHGLPALYGVDSEERRLLPAGGQASEQRPLVASDQPLPPPLPPWWGGPVQSHPYFPHFK